MSHTTHTLSPWVYDERYNNVVTEDGGAVAERPFWSSLSPDSEEADMRLIAAAPELLEALEKAIKSYWLSIDYAHNRTPEACEIRREMLAAIANAKGI